jgi:biotin operon repressor
MSDAERVLSLLTNASVTQADMAFVLDLSIRAVQAACEELRRAGHPILSSGDGIRLAQTADEALSCAAALRKRAITQWVTARALRRTGLRMKTMEDAVGFLTLWRVAS